MRKLMMLCLLVPASLAGIQERVLVLDEGREINPPTPADAMQAIMEPRQGHNSPADPAIAVLRQVYERRSGVELAGLVAQLERVALDDDDGTAQMYARGALSAAARTEGNGTPYPGALDALIRTYERAVEDNGTDPGRFMFDIYHAGDTGVSYVVDTFETAEVPPRCYPQGRVEHAKLLAEGFDPTNPCPNESPWCDAGIILRDFQPAALQDRRVVLDERCGWNRWITF